MLGSLRREHLAAVGFPEAYYLTSEQKIAVVNALTDEQRDLITRDFLVKSLTSDIGFDKTGKQLLMEFAALHHKEKYEVVKAQFDEEYTKRNDRLDERIAVAEAQEKAKTKAAKKEGKTGKSTKKIDKESRLNSDRGRPQAVPIKPNRIMLKEFIDDLRRHGIAVFDLIQAGAGNHIFFAHAETAILGVSGFPGNEANTVIPCISSPKNRT